jgi:hypothetical protein
MPLCHSKSLASLSSSSPLAPCLTLLAHAQAYLVPVIYPPYGVTVTKVDESPTVWVIHPGTQAQAIMS